MPVSWVHIIFPGLERLSHNITDHSLCDSQESRSLNLADTKHDFSPGEQITYLTGVSPLAFLTPSAVLPEQPIRITAAAIVVRRVFINLRQKSPDGGKRSLPEARWIGMLDVIACRQHKALDFSAKGDCVMRRYEARRK